MSHPLTADFWLGWRGGFVAVATIALYLAVPYQLLPPKIGYLLADMLSATTVPIGIWVVRSIKSWLRERFSGGLSDDGPPAEG